MEQLTRPEAISFLASRPVAHLGTVMDGAPYVTPMSFVVDGDRILLRTLAGAKLDAIKANPDVCVETSVFDDETGDWMSAIVRGKARLIDEATIQQRVVSLLYSKYAKVMGSPLSGGGGLMPLGGTPFVIEITIDEITGMSSGRGMSVRTKPGRM